MRKGRNQQKRKQVKKTQYNVSSPVEYEDSQGDIQTFWQSIGRAFEGKKGITVLLNALPVNGKLFISESNQDDHDEDEE